MLKLDRKWAVATCLMVLLIWGNSMVPGTGSGSLSLSIMEAVRGFLNGMGLPYEWVTNFVVRKCAHFTEYMVLGILATHAFDIEGRRTFDVLLPTAVFLLLIPSIDETIQLFVPGRAGMITDVMIDCCGAMTGVVLRYLLRSLTCAKKAAQDTLLGPRRPFFVWGLIQGVAALSRRMGLLDVAAPLWLAYC